MYTSQDTPSVSNKRVRLTLIIALIVIGSWSVRLKRLTHDGVRREGFCFSCKMIACCLRLLCTFKSGFNNTTTRLSSVDSKIATGLHLIRASYVFHLVTDHFLLVQVDWLYVSSIFYLFCFIQLIYKLFCIS